MEPTQEEALPRIVTARDGGRLVLRHIRPEDWRGLQAGYDMYTDAQKRLRMLDTVPRLTEAMARAFATIADPEHEFCLVLVTEGREDDFLGGARLMGAPGREDAEFSVSIRADQQGRGLGRLALAAALEEGRRRGIRRVWGLISRQNAPMQALARALGFTLRPDPDDWALLLAERDLRAGSPRRARRLPGAPATPPPRRRAPRAGRARRRAACAAPRTPLAACAAP